MIVFAVFNTLVDKGVIAAAGPGHIDAIIGVDRLVSVEAHFRAAVGTDNHGIEGAIIPEPECH
jgi:hypothetical protein